ncbi:MAG: endonuclease domain-containing protein [bacterium]|nr:endonuclease domain-containing protein [bacterium]
MDGSQHLEKESKEYDEVRTEYLKGLGIRVLRFTNLDVTTNIHKVLVKITSHLSSSPPC